LPEAQAKGIEDLSALNALYRPGPIDGGMVDDFILRHHGRRASRYIVPQMKEILDSTNGVIVLPGTGDAPVADSGGYSMGEADSCAGAWARRTAKRWLARSKSSFRSRRARH
jgi:DNA polymerase-3 subunit alpha